VWRYDEARKELTAVDETLPWPNGLALSLDEQILYIIDTKKMSIFSKVLDAPSAPLENLITMDTQYGDGVPDGMRLDREGNIYSTGPGGIWVISASGKALGIICLPEVAANLCFDDTGLFITASSSVYHINTLIKGALL
jgi:gluconolactonase